MRVVLLDTNVPAPGFVGTASAAVRLIDVWRTGGYDLVVSDGVMGPLTWGNEYSTLSLPVNKFITGGSAMKEIVSSITRKGQVTIPAEVRKHLGVGTPDKVAFVLEDEGVRLKPATVTLESLYGSVPALPNESADLEREIDEAKQEAADRIVGRPERR